MILAVSGSGTKSLNGMLNQGSVGYSQLTLGTSGHTFKFKVTMQGSEGYSQLTIDTSGHTFKFKETI